MPKIKPENYINIQGWMVLPPYELKGNELLVFACIYGFCQVSGQKFIGSIDYLSEWTNSSRPSVINTLRSLQDKGLIKKVISKPTNEYYIPKKEIVYQPDDLNNNKSKETLADPKESLDESKESLEGSQETLDNNIDYNISNNIDNTLLPFEEHDPISSSIKEIITHLNKTCGTRFRPTVPATKKLIKSLMKAGFSLDDFKKVIEYKYETWGRNPVRFKNGNMSNTYLTPSTLFGPKFEKYLLEAESGSCEEDKLYDSRSVEPDDERSNVYF